MSILIIASSEPGAGRSLIAAALASRIARSMPQVTLARLGGDDGAARDASAFAALESIHTPGHAIDVAYAASLSTEVVLEAPAGSVAMLASGLKNARVIQVADPAPSPVDIGALPLAGTIVTRAPAAEVPAIAARSGTLGMLPEDRVLASPTVQSIAERLGATTLVESEHDGSLDRVLLGTVASDAASPYFANHGRTCVITRFDKTDIQLAALNTDLACLVLTGGGDPSPYLLDRVRGMRDRVAVLLASLTTVEAMRAIEGLYGRSPFAGISKLSRAIGLLDAAGVPETFG